MLKKTASDDISMESSSPRVVVNQSPKSTIGSNNSSISTMTTTNNNNSNVPITRSESNNPYPTTFVQADTSSFKQVVQMLTGSPETVTRRQDPTRSNTIPPPMKPAGAIRKNDQYKSSAASRLYERRNSLKNSFKISPLGHARPGFNLAWTQPGTPEVLSPSLLDFPSLVLSPVTPLISDPFNRVGSGLDAEAEEKAIKEKGFYLHPSPRDSDTPRLLTLFPLTSPRAREGSSSSSSNNGGDGAAAAE